MELLNYMVFFQMLSLTRVELIINLINYLLFTRGFLSLVIENVFFSILFLVPLLPKNVTDS